MVTEVGGSSVAVCGVKLRHPQPATTQNATLEWECQLADARSGTACVYIAKVDREAVGGSLRVSGTVQYSQRDAV